MHAPDRVQALAERLVATPSPSPDVEAETRCARVIADALPAGIEHGTWAAPDGRPIVWARLRGKTPRTLILLAHYDTVSASAYAPLGDPALAFDPERLAVALPRWAAARDGIPPALRDDLDEEARAPGTWRFGRGLLDMKSAIAAGIAALGALAERPEPGLGVLFVITPDEEHLSAGMRAAAVELLRLREREGLAFEGVLNLDYGLEPALYAGVEGKLQLGAWVLGSAAHVADPHRGPDAITIAAWVVSALVEAPGRESHERSAMPLAFHDLKSGYSIEPATETLVELTVPWSGATLERVLGETRARIEQRLAATCPTATVTTLAALAEQAPGAPPARSANGGRVADDVDRYATIARLRAVCAATGLAPPAVVLHLLPPFYPPSPPRGSRLVEVARALAAGESLPMRGSYPFISDASYAAWRCAGLERLEDHLPALRDGYALPIDAARSLDLDVVNLGPWGRDAHTMFERVHAPFAFARLPRLIERFVRDLARA